ncbi:MAG: hypothetical protein ACNA8W_06020 [Bradymonadaceae bacterium]
MMCSQKRAFFFVLALAVFSIILVPANEAAAGSPESHARWKANAPAQAAARGIPVPVQIGIGPVGYLIGTPKIEEFRLGGPIIEDQLFHTGLRISLAAVIDRELVRKYPRLVPNQYRGHVERAGEVRVSPMVAALIPSSLFISPKWRNTGIYGSTWALFRLGMTLLNDPIRVSAGVGLLGTYAYIYSDNFAATHFLRPGLDGVLDIEIPLTRDFLVSFGWASQFYIPQNVGGSILEIPLDGGNSIWHMGQVYMQFHFRVPYMYYR